MYRKFLLGMFLSLTIVACHHHRSGPMERAGERLDEIGDNIQEGKNPLHKKGKMEKAGEAIDDAVGSNRR